MITLKELNAMTREEKIETVQALLQSGVLVKDIIKSQSVETEVPNVQPIRTMNTFKYELNNTLSGSELSERLIRLAELLRNGEKYDLTLQIKGQGI